MSTKAGVADPDGKSLGVAFADFDGDGFTDIFVANDNVRQFLFRNKGDGTFEDVALLAGVGYDENGKSFSGMGVDAADYNGDGLVDVFVTALSNETYPLFRNNGDMTFTYATSTTGVGLVTIPYSGWGVRFADFDGDGLRDIFVAQGHVLDTIEKTTGFLTYKQTPLLLRNTGKGFVNVSQRRRAFRCRSPRAVRPLAISTTTATRISSSRRPTARPSSFETRARRITGSASRSRAQKANRQALGARVIVTDAAGSRQFLT